MWVYYCKCNQRLGGHNMFTPFLIGAAAGLAYGLFFTAISNY